MDSGLSDVIIDEDRYFISFMLPSGAYFYACGEVVLISGEG
jgi:hypothetical protein